MNLLRRLSTMRANNLHKEEFKEDIARRELGGMGTAIWEMKELDEERFVHDVKEKGADLVFGSYATYFKTPADRFAAILLSYYMRQELLLESSPKGSQQIEARGSRPSVMRSMSLSM